MLVEIWSDVVCPWCAVGKARFEQALSDAPYRDEVEVVWRSFELDPTRPRTTDDAPYVERLAAKYGVDVAEAQAMIDRMVAAGAEEGMEFRFDRVRPGNTFDAHRVLHHAAARGRQHEVKDRFLVGYHTEGAAIGEHDELVRLGREAGLVEDEVREVLAGDLHHEDVRADERQAAAYGARGVPFFVIDRTYGVSGAQPAPLLRRALDEARGAVPATSVASGHSHAPGEACVDGACVV